MNLPTTLSLLQIDQLDPAARAEMNLGLGGKNGAVSRSLAPFSDIARRRANYEAPFVLFLCETALFPH